MCAAHVDGGQNTVVFSDIGSKKPHQLERQFYIKSIKFNPFLSQTLEYEVSVRKQTEEGRKQSMYPAE
jgi:hypothetical protein